MSAPAVDGTALRAAARDFVRDQLAEGAFTPAVDAFARSFSADFSARLGARGWLGMTWPTRYGGHERSALDRFAVIEELLAAGAPVAAHWIADRQIGATLLRFGSEEQREYFLPRIATGELSVAAGLSEPDSGSDLASVRTTAVRVRDGWAVTGTKVWTSHAHRADWLLTLVRTTPRTDDSHAGLSQVFVDLHGPGVNVRPITVMGGEAHFTEVVLDGAFVPDSRVVGRVGEGWRQINAELSYERSGPERYLAAMPLLTELVTTPGCADLPAATHASLGHAVARLRAVRALSLHVQHLLDVGVDPAVDAAMVKDLGTELEQDLVDVVGEALSELPAADRPRLELLLRQARYAAPTFTLRGGTTEIVRSIVARSLPGPTGGQGDQAMVTDAVAALGRHRAAEAEAEIAHAGFSATQWRLLADGGFVDPEQDADGPEVAALLRATGRFGLAVPLAEHLAAARAVAAAGLTMPGGVLTAAMDTTRDPVEVVGPAEDRRLTGTLHAVPWAGIADAVVVAVPCGPTHLVGVLPRDAARTHVRPDLADAPSARVELPATGLPLTPLPPGVAPSVWWERSRALVALGGVRAVLDLTGRYAHDRTQFGRPLVRFQAVSQRLAVLAAALASADALADVAPGESRTTDATASAQAIRLTAERAARLAIAVGHQVHGALGVTEEYALHRFTRRLMAWRDGSGPVTAAASELGRRAVAAGADLWPELATDQGGAR